MRAGNPGKFQGGYLLVVLLFALALFGMGLATVGRWESEIAQREHEAELLRQGVEVVEAIRSYYRVSPGSINLLPLDWKDLLEDHRFIGTVRHLRRVPIDPFSHRDDWTILRNSQGAMLGIASKSSKRPLQRSPVQTAGMTLKAAEHYSDWKFAYDPSTETAPPAVVAGKPAK